MENVIEKADALDADQLPGRPTVDLPEPDGDGTDPHGDGTDPELAEQLRSEIAGSNESCVVDKKVVKQIAYFKAINEGHSEQIQ